MSHELFFIFAQNGDIWRRMRKVANEEFSKSSVKGFYETQNTEAVLLASDLLASPKRWDRHFRRAPASTTLTVLYGYPTLKSEQDPIVVAINEFAERTYLVHFFPWLRYLPSGLAKWKRDAEAWYKQDTAMFERLFQTVEANIAKGDDRQSVAASLIREREKNKLSSIERVWFGGTMYLGGADTTSVTMAWWTLAMLAYPETQARAHAELDAVVAAPVCRPSLTSHTYPTFVPWSRKPYAGDHPPRWAHHIDPLRMAEIYGKNPEDFDPGRHLDPSGYVASGVPDVDLKEHGNFTFGFGRRNCVGRYMADNALFINIAVILWATKLERKKDATGDFLPLNLDGWVNVGLVARPIPFEFEITPRFQEAPAMLAQEPFFRAEDVGKGRKFCHAPTKQSESTRSMQVNYEMVSARRQRLNILNPEINESPLLEWGVREPCGAKVWSKGLKARARWTVEKRVVTNINESKIRLITSEAQPSHMTKWANANDCVTTAFGTCG
ncbi:cytochrome P450 [Russula vinacea]|nr:cytochrome P450 [Russula vinacea]